MILEVGCQIIVNWDSSRKFEKNKIIIAKLINDKHKANSVYSLRSCSLEDLVETSHVGAQKYLLRIRID